MKRLFTAILAILYMGTSMGATLHMHYCMGKLADWTLSIGKPGTCPKCGMENSLRKGKSCCSDEQKTFKNSTDQKAAETSFQAIYSVDAVLSPAVLDAPPVYIISVTEANPVSNAPPPCNSVAIYIRNCIFRI